MLIIQLSTILLSNFRIYGICRYEAKQRNERYFLGKLMSFPQENWHRQCNVYAWSPLRIVRIGPLFCQVTIEASPHFNSLILINI